MKVVGYARVSTDEQATNGASLAVQVTAIGRTARETPEDHCAEMDRPHQGLVVQASASVTA